MVDRAVRPRGAFTLIELLVVILIIMILLSLLIPGIYIVRKQVGLAKTNAIIAMVRTALAKTGADQEAVVQPVPHPLAATAAGVLAGAADPRARFYRASDRTLLRLTGEALTLDDETWIAATERDRILSPDDRFGGYLADGDVPSLFGLERRLLGIVGLAAPWIDRVRQLPRPVHTYGERDAVGELTGMLRQHDTSVTGHGACADPYCAQVYPDRLFLSTRPIGTEEPYEVLVGRELARALGPAISELTDLGAVAQSPAANETATWIKAADGTTDIDVGAPEAGAYDPHHRVWTGPDDTGGEGMNLLRIGGELKLYAPRGSYLVDYWGNVLLYAIDAGGKPMILSPGMDGYFLVDPGANGVIDSDITTLDPATGTGLLGDDGWAQGDNQGGVKGW